MCLVYDIQKAVIENLSSSNNSTEIVHIPTVKTTDNKCETYDDNNNKRIADDIENDQQILIKDLKEQKMQIKLLETKIDKMKERESVINDLALQIRDKLLL